VAEDEAEVRDDVSHHRQETEHDHDRRQPTEHEHRDPEPLELVLVDRGRPLEGAEALGQEPQSGTGDDDPGRRQGSEADPAGVEGQHDPPSDLVRHLRVGRS